MRDAVEQRTSNWAIKTLVLVKSELSGSWRGTVSYCLIKSAVNIYTKYRQKIEFPALGVIYLFFKMLLLQGTVLEFKMFVTCVWKSKCLTA